MTQKSAPNNRLAGLDTLRALAILLVMLFHLHWLLPDGSGPIARFGWMDVDLFFVLSGYLIGSQLLKPLREGRGVSLTGFYRNRAYRILPAYLVLLALDGLWPAWREDTGMSPL
jgi:peptidoglycan/LPS O-acetylase OafA/YrhL